MNASHARELVIEEACDERVQHLIDQTRKRSEASLIASRVCLGVLMIATLLGILLFLLANKIVETTVPLQPPTTVDARGGSGVSIVIDQKLSKDTVGRALEHDWRNRVLTQVSALVARVCIVGLLVFIMQFVMKLFRYYHATHLYLRARADALYVSRIVSVDLDKALAFLSAQPIEFGDSPTSPIESIVSGFKLAADSKK